MDDFHRPPAKNVGRTNDDRITDLFGDGASFARRLGDAAVRLRELQLFDQGFEAVAIFRQIDGIGRGAENRHARFLERASKLQRRLAAELDDDALELAVGAFDANDFEHVLGGQRFEEAAGRTCRSPSRRSRDCS